MAQMSDEEQRELDNAYEAAMEEEWKMKTLENELTPIVKRIIMKDYPEAFRSESEGYKALDSIVWRHVDRLVRDVNNAANSMAAER